jgi:hypothetical protein
MVLPARRRVRKEAVSRAWPRGAWPPRAHPSDFGRVRVDGG